MQLTKSPRPKPKPPTHNQLSSKSTKAGSNPGLGVFTAAYASLYRNMSKTLSEVNVPSGKPLSL